MLSHHCDTGKVLDIVDSINVLQLNLSNKECELNLNPKISTFQSVAPPRFE